MAEFAHGTIESQAAEIKIIDSGRTAFLNGSGRVRFSFARTRVQVLLSGDSEKHEHVSQRAVIQAPDGVRIIPYFKRDDAWHVVLVEQFRIALSAKTIEPAGGEADCDDPRVAMARELLEEARISVDHENIQVVYKARIQPSMMASLAYGGIVEIQESDLPSELVGGEWKHGEYTVLVVRPFLDLLHSSDRDELDLDLETKLLFDRLAERLGLIDRKY